MPPTGTPIDAPLAELLALVNGTIEPTLQQVLTLLQANNGAIEIPGSVASRTATKGPA